MGKREVIRLPRTGKGPSGSRILWARTDERGAFLRVRISVSNPDGKSRVEADMERPAAAALCFWLLSELTLDEALLVMREAAKRPGLSERLQEVSGG